MRKSIITASLIWILPLTTFAALKAPKGAPLQPLPINTAPNINTNINTPGNSYNASQQQIQNQQPEAQTDSDGEEAPAPSNIQTNLSTAESNPLFYWILILVAGVCLLVMLGYIVYRYRK